MAIDEIRVEQGEGENGFGILLRPFTIQVRLLEAMSQELTVHRREVLFEALHLQKPLALRDKGLWTDNKYRRQVYPCAELLDDEAGLNGFTHTHLVGNQ